MGYDFSKAQGVELSSRGKYLDPGRYTLKVKRNIVFQSRKKEDFWIATFEVLESDNPEHPAGTERNWMQKINDPTVGFRAVKSFVFAAMGLDYKDPDTKKMIDKEIEPQITTVLAEALEDPADPNCKNALKDTVVKCEVSKIITKEKKQEFNLHSFSKA